MGAIVKLLLCAILCASVQGVCRRVKNEDMIEYSCMGGQLSDLDNLPISTGKIRISNMPIRRITANTFSRFGSDLWVLGCSHCGIIDIEPRAFAHLNNLQQLSLNNNHLIIVKESWFKGLNYLTYLDLNYNNIESIEDGVFLNLPSLVDLRLSGNRLECLNLVAMSQLKDLKRIFLSENSEFKCPNAISIYLEDRGINFEKDPEWSRLSNDLIPVTIPLDYDEITTIKMPVQPYSGYRERLHPITTIPTSTMTSTLQYITPKFQTTEEVIYRPYNIPNWKTTFKSSTIRNENKIKITQSPSYEYTKASYISQKTIAPIESTTYVSSLRETIQNNSQDTTFRSWPSFSESTTARIEYPVYPPHKNEDKHYTKQSDYLSPIDSFSLAPNKDDHHQMSSIELDMQQTVAPYRTDSLEKNIILSNMQYPSSIENKLSSIDSSDTIHTTQSTFSSPEIVQPAHSDDIHSNISSIKNGTQSIDTSNSTHIQPIPYSPPSMVQPAYPNNIYQPPYYESTVTIHSPPLMDNKSQQKEVTPGIVLIETTTDKPLPKCPTRNLSTSNQSSIRMIIVSVLLMITNHVFAEGF